MGTAFSTLRDSLSQNIGDYLHDTVTTALTTSTAVVCTRLNEITTQDDYFNGWYILITSENNDGEMRKISDYDEGTTTLTVYGANWSDDGANLATFELHKYNPTNKLRAVNNAARELYPALYRKLFNQTLITGNILPPFDWSSATALNLYSTSNASIAKTTTAGYFWNGDSSAKVTASAADGYLYLGASAYPRLLDLKDYEADFKCWAYPEVADDAFLTIYTVKADGTAQTLNSTTTCPAGKWTLLELEDQSINDDIVDIQFRLRAHTNAKYVYFDFPRVNGRSIYEYMLPTDFQNGKLRRVYLQTTGYADDPCDDLHPTGWEELFGWRIVDDGTYKYVRIPYLSDLRKLRLEGICPLEDNLSADTDTISLEGERLNLLYAYATYLMYEMQRDVVSSDSVARLDAECQRWFSKAELLKKTLRMPRPSSVIRWSI